MEFGDAAQPQMRQIAQHLRQRTERLGSEFAAGPSESYRHGGIARAVFI
jgi:hypothetical protein